MVDSWPISCSWAPELQIQMPNAYVKKLTKKGIMSIDSGSRIFVHWYWSGAKVITSLCFLILKMRVNNNADLLSLLRQLNDLMHVKASQVVLAVKKKKNSPANSRDKRRRFDPWVGKIAWRKAWQPTPVFLPGESHGWRSLVGYTAHRVSKSQTRTKQLSKHARSVCRRA